MISAMLVAMMVGWSGYRSMVGHPIDALDDPWHVGHRIVDRHGQLLREQPGEHGRRGQPQSLEQMGDRLILATLAAEDRSFYEHDGLNRFAILRAVHQNLRHGELISGASTITQQLVKLLDTRGIPGVRTPAAKLREAARAQNLEQELSKPDILTAYLNRLPYGHGLVGPRAAAQGYFGVASHQLSWAQAAFLAVLPRAPSYLDPYRAPDRVFLRQRAVLDALLEAEVISAAEHAAAHAEPISVRPLERPFSAPHFVQTLVQEDRLSATPTTETTIDAGLQRDTEGLIRTHMAHVSDWGASDAAAIVLDNRTGDILAYVGSADFHDPAIAGQVDMVSAARQPGSTLKPFVYELAYEQGLSPHDLVADVPTVFEERGGHFYAPKNFHGDVVGPITSREALAASLNIPVIRLAAEFPPGALLERLHQLGFDRLTEDAEFYGLSLALGSGEVELRELATAYMTLARGGSAIALRYTASDPPPTPKSLIDPSLVAAITDALSDPLARVRLLQGGRSPFDIGFPIALKTGTSSGHRDAWTVGYTAERTVAVWVGNANGSAMNRLTGASAAGPLFADIMRRAMADLPGRAPLFDTSQLEDHTVCPLSGHRPGPACPAGVIRRFPRGHGPSETCSIHRHARKQGAHFVCDPSGDQTIAVFSADYDRWFEGLPSGAPGHSAFDISWLPERDTLQCQEPNEETGTLEITTPTEGSVTWIVHEATDRIELLAEYHGPRAEAPDEVEFVIDGRVVGRSTHPFQAVVALPRGDHLAYARPRDTDAAVRSTPRAFAVR